MAAGIVESADLAIITTHNDDRVGSNLDGEVVSWGRNFAVVTDEEPVTVPNVFQIKLVVCGIDIERFSTVLNRVGIPAGRDF